MTITYKLKKELVARAAVQLNWELKELNSEVSIVGARVINAKSLVGILSGDFHKGDIIKVNFSLSTDRENIEKIFSDIGEICDRQI